MVSCPKGKKILVAIGTLFIISTVVFYLLYGQVDTGELVPLAVTDTSPCNARLGSSLRENLEKIGSYKFPRAQPYLKKLVPKDFQFHSAKYYTKGDIANESLPSIPAIVTACSANHFSEAMELVGNVNYVVRPVYKNMKFFFYDMGLTASQREKVIKNCNCAVITFPFKDFPDHVRNLKGYAWKPLAIQLALKKHRFVMWMDASIRFETKQLDWAFKHAQSLGVSASLGFVPIAARTQKETFEFLEEPPCLFRNINEFEATFIMIYGTDLIMQYFMIPWVSCALSHGCMVPKDSPEKYLICSTDNYYFSCHRFDQSILSILMARLFSEDLRAHVILHTFFKICKGGYDLPFLPDFVNKVVTKQMRTCF